MGTTTSVDRLSKIALIFAVAVATVEATCPSGAVQSITDSTVCYSFYSTQLRFTDAEQICTDNGGHLASVKNGFVNVFLAEQAQKIFVRVNASSFWIGANDLSSSGVWSWTSGDPFSYSDWKQGEPNTNPGFDCGKVSMLDGYWAANNCFAEMPFVCTTPPVTGATCAATCDEGWAVFNSSCYKLGFNANYDDAEANCVTNGGHLASIHSTQESIFVSQLARTGMNEDNTHQPWIGLKTPDGSNWFWSDGSKLDFNGWGTGQPNNGSANSCGQIFADKSIWPQDAGLYEKWMTHLCSKSARAFICKKPSH